MPFLKKKAKIAVIIVAAVAALGIVTAHFAGQNPVTNVIRTVMSPFQSGFSYIGYKLSRAVNFIWEADTYRAENEELSARLAQLEQQSKETAQYRVENERLSELLDLKNSLSQFETVAASVIGYSKNNWYDKIEINKGTLNGIEKGNPVICSDGIVGLVEEAGPDWAVVSTVINPDSAVGIRVTRTGDVGVAEGDDDLCMNSMCKLTFIDKGVNIIVGDLLETSGAGGIYPAGFIVGTIREISSDNMGILNYAVIEPKADFSRLHEVLVINKIK
ncbi:MAG: rod shape-determining protein MreC [Clostridiales bacterium]|nr:rod shape-determining protein MreC [Clostridiales bacterium]